jgi:N-acetylneuraminic acid mutarotase
MSKRQLLFLLLIVIVFLTASGVPNSSLNSGWIRDSDTALIVGRNINMVSGTKLPGGDPWLQRQNEPSIAVSTRNPLHLLAGANDYRTIDMPDPEKKIPGQEEAATPPRDAWLGVFKSFDGGQSWISTLLPGFPQDTSDEGFYSPLQQADYYTAADPVVRAGTNGLFYYSGIAFERDTKKGVVFVSRFIDNNNKENGDPIKYIGTVIIYSSKSGEFIDKPWIAVDIPRDAAHTVPIILPDTPIQYIPASDVYIAYSVFSGEGVNRKSKILFAKSIDCGATWGTSIELSTGQNLNQGATIAVDPRQNGQLYVAWRRFTNRSQADAIIVASSNNGGKKFNKVTEVASIAKFDQGTTVATFRTNSYPSLVADNKGIVYLAWSQRGVGPGGDARIVISTSNNGIQWSSPKPIDNHSGRGHQFMPSLTYAGSKIIAAWYDERDDFSERFDYYINDVSGEKRHTTDIRVAQADASKNPFFGESLHVSRYLHAITKDGIKQIRFNPPNYPLFELGTKPFHGDYIDISPSPMFLPEHKWRWTCNTSSSQSLVFHVVWTDNRDVKPPVDGDWTNYTPPNSDQVGEFFRQAPLCSDDSRAGMRNQNIYTSRITQGLEVGSPGNSKPLGKIQRAFVVFVKNTTDATRRFKLTIGAPWGVKASFLQFKIVDKLIVAIAPYSSISRTVFVKSSDPDATVKVDVSEVGGVLQSFILLNPDDTNPEITNPDMEPSNPKIENLEVHNPNIENPNIENPNIENPDIVNPNIENPDIVNPDIVNPNIENPDIVNPDIENPDIVNPNIENPNIENPDIENGSLTDNTWIVTNNGNTTSAYTFKMLAANFNTKNYPGFGFQLLIYRVHKTPIAVGCELKQEHHDELIANIVNPYINPNIENPNIENPDIENSSITNATFCAEPKDEVWVSLRVYDPNKNDNVKFDPRTVTGVVTAQAVNTKDAQEGSTTPPVAMSPVKILTKSLPDGVTGQSYSTTLTATGGSGKYTWSLAYESGALPSGLQLSSNGVISGTPEEEETSYPHFYTFTVQVTDSNNLSQTATKDLTIQIAEPLLIETDSLPDGAIGNSYSETLYRYGGIGPFIWSVASGSLPSGLSLDNYSGTISGTPTATGTSSFTIGVADSTSTPQSYSRVLSITIISGAAFKLVFTQQPGGGVGGEIWTQQPIVEVQDAAGNTVTSDNSTEVTLNIGDNPGNGELSDPTTVTVIAGVATFSGLKIDMGGWDYTLKASAGRSVLTPAVSNSFDIEGFSGAGDMSTPRMSQTATLLSNGKILIIGGDDGNGDSALASAEIYDPADGSFTATANSMNEARYGHTATRLSNGKVLITGGKDVQDFEMNSAEIYDPAYGTFTKIEGGMNVARYGHTATRLGDGRVLITGGSNGETTENSAEIYDPETGKFTLFESTMTTARSFHTATLLSNGNVLIAGGGAAGEVTNSAEIFEHDSQTFSSIEVGMNDPRLSHTATKLSDGKVLITGGNIGEGYTWSADLFDPDNGTFASTAHMNTSRAYHTATLLSDGNVLIIGGADKSGFHSSAEIYSAGSFRNTGSMTIARGYNTATLLSDGRRVLITGGYSGESTLGSAEIFWPKR